MNSNGPLRYNYPDITKLTNVVRSKKVQSSFYSSSSSESELGEHVVTSKLEKSQQQQQQQQQQQPPPPQIANGLYGFSFSSSHVGKGRASPTKKKQVQLKLDSFGAKVQKPASASAALNNSDGSILSLLKKNAVPVPRVKIANPASSQKRSVLPVEKREKVDSSGQCWICLDPTWSDGDEIVYCDGRCGSSTHLSCYGLKRVPAGDFFCEGCAELNMSSNPIPKCVLCKKAGGLLKRSVCQQWVHSLCVHFILELRMNAEQRAENLWQLDPERKELKCKVCHERGGCAQCAVPECFEAFHPFCAYLNRTEQMVVRESPEDGLLHCELYCRKHRYCIPNVETVTYSRNPLRQLEEQEQEGNQQENAADDDEEEDTVPVRRKRLVEEESQSPSEEEPARKRPKAAEEGGGARGSHRGVYSKSRTNAATRGCFDLEAVLSDEEEWKGSGDESGSSDDDNDRNISGDFINDGAYTQLSPNDGGYGMYLAVDHFQKLVDSPEDYADGKRLNIQKIMKQHQPSARAADSSLEQSAVLDTSVETVLRDSQERSSEEEDWTQEIFLNNRTNAATENEDALGNGRDRIVVGGEDLYDEETWFTQR